MKNSTMMTWPNGAPSHWIGAGAPFKIVAVVSMSHGEAFVLNRRPRFLYERHGQNLIGSDGPFRDVLGYERPAQHAKAFGGREFDIPMRDGTIVHASGQYWQSFMEGMVGVTLETVEGLRECYVFSGGVCADPDEIAALRAEYTGPVYGYWDYEKVVKS